ncbi:PEP-CTERM sorting domain-containing protein [Bythopirellula goksoeyrii]|uniref:PEP-CTERM protein-sorting domain-containing protein n=1 Tax=Bythopirellula goksoeyrii TaxID=1400387 RepID=A0A5B9Q8G8_9BACT|nr:PEP-CTERM sorting domain-containing protein [Bythopirellula goksoeyrii]QEG33732.1 hypothetical protein Pr1d_09970 [Bythopirellula goksoeyrii]
MTKMLTRTLYALIFGLFSLTITTPANADFAAPQSWNRGDVNTTYQHWDFFDSYPTDSTPDVGNINPSGTASLTETTGTALPLGSGNIYGAASAAQFVVTIPEQDIPSYDLTALVQIKVGGTELDVSSLALNSLAPVKHNELSRVEIPGRGATVEHQFLFQVSYANYGDGVGPDVTDLTLNFGAVEAMLSLDQVSIDTAIQPSGFFPERIPEPSSALLGLLAGAGVLLRRRNLLLGAVG